MNAPKDYDEHTNLPRGERRSNVERRDNPCRSGELLAALLFGAAGVLVGAVSCWMYVTF